MAAARRCPAGSGHQRRPVGRARRVGDPAVELAATTRTTRPGGSRSSSSSTDRCGPGPVFAGSHCRSGRYTEAGARPRRGPCGRCCAAASRARDRARYAPGHPRPTPGSARFSACKRRAGRFVDPAAMTAAVSPGGSSPATPRRASRDPGRGGWVATFDDAFHLLRPERATIPKRRLPHGGGGDGRLIPSSGLLTARGPRFSTCV